MPSDDHQRQIAEQFTQQVDRFVMSPHVNAQEPVQRFLRLMAPHGDENALDVGCGPGLLARALAPHVAHIEGIDLTPAMVDKARQIASEAGLNNTSFTVGSSYALPYADGSFDLVTTRLALHHMDDPAQAILEMARVLKPGGHLAVFDMATAEIAAEADEHNAVERLRDPTHVLALAPSTMLKFIGAAGLDFVRGDSTSLTLEVEDWIARAEQDAASAAEAKNRLHAAIGTRRFGGRRVWQAATGLCFEGRYLMWLAEKPTR